MAQRVAIVTGANSGIGFRAAQILCQQGMEVILACRSEERGIKAVKKIKDAQADARLQLMLLDLASLYSVQRFAASFLAQEKYLHILVNNAGVFNYGVRRRRETSDGLELHFGTNHVGHFLLTSLLLDRLKQAGTSDCKSRIVVVTSEMHNTQCRVRMHRKKPADMDFYDLNLTRSGVYSPHQAYKNSKAANVMFTYKLSKMLANDNVTVNCMTPGWIPATRLLRHASKMKKFFFKCAWRSLNITRTVDHGAGTIVQLSTDSEYEGESGRYYSGLPGPRGSPPKGPTAGQSSTESRDEEKQDILWLFTQTIIAEKLPGVEIM